MNQSELDRAVACATGESRRTIGRMGFSPADALDPSFDPEPADVAKFLDWDRLARGRYGRLAVH